MTFPLFCHIICTDIGRVIIYSHMNFIRQKSVRFGSTYPLKREFYISALWSIPNICSRTNFVMYVFKTSLLPISAKIYVVHVALGCPMICISLISNNRASLAPALEPK